MPTIALKLKLRQPNGGKARKMRAAVESYRQACAWFAGEAERLRTTSRTGLNRATYSRARGMFDLNSATLQAAMLKALAARRSYLAHRAQGDKRAQPPQFSRPLPVMVRQDCYAVHRLASGTWVLRFPVAAGRSQMAVPLVVSPYHARYLADLAGGSCRQGAMEFWLGANGQWCVSLTLVYEVSAYEPDGVIGVDLGIVKLAVLSNNSFYDGRAVRWRKERWAERRQGLQEAGRLARVKRERGRERRWMRDINHKVSRQIVDQACREGKAIALEQLTGIRDRTKGTKRLNRMVSGWNFGELAAFIAYKAALAGVPVVWVDPTSTSKTCPRCGYAARANRPSQGWFKCGRCGYQSDADRVGALNVAARGAMPAGYSPAGEGSVAPLKAPGRLSPDSAVQANLLLPTLGSPAL